MRLSVWPQANAHPRSKEEKILVGYQVSRPNLPETAEFNTDEELLHLVTTYAWSPFVFSGYRHADNFVSCDLLVYDIDDGLTIDETHAIAKKHGLCCLCLPSPSHSEELHKFRIILPLARTIYSPEIYTETWLKGAELFGTVDEQCKDLARFFNSSTQDDGFWEEGSFFEPVEPKNVPISNLGQSPEATTMLPVSGDINDIVKSIYGEERSVIPEAVDYFVRNAHTGMPGQWINALNRFCFSLALSEVPDDVILTVCNELAPDILDRKDLYQINRAINDAKKEL